MSFYGFAYISAPVKRVYLVNLYLKKIEEIKKLPVFDNIENKNKDIIYGTYHIPSYYIEFSEKMRKLYNFLPSLKEIKFDTFEVQNRLRIAEFKRFLTVQKFRFIFFCKGWDTDPICREEHNIALSADYKIELFYE